jgi:phage tail protein X
MIYTAKEGDRLDLVVARHYGNLADRKVERVLEANPGLCVTGFELALGQQIELPELAPAAPLKQAVRLWS